MVKNIWDVQQSDSGFDGRIRSLAKEKLREGRAACTSIFINEGRSDLINDVEFIFIDKSCSLDPTRREEFWTTKIKLLMV